MQYNDLNYSEEEELRFQYVRNLLSNIYKDSNLFIGWFAVVCNEIELGKLSDDALSISKIKEQLEKGKIDLNKYKQKIEEAHKSCKDAQQIKIKLNNIKYQLTDGDMYLRLPYEEPEINLQQLLRNFAVIIIDNMKLVQKNLKKMTEKYNNVMSANLPNFEQEGIDTFALLARPLKIIRNYIFGNLYHEIDKHYPNVCKTILTEEIGEIFKNLNRIVNG